MVCEVVDNKGKEVMPPMEREKGKAVVPPLEVTPVQRPLMDEDMPEKPPSNKHRNYGHYHEDGGPTHLCKVIMAP
ncbi:U-box domain-containing protein 4 [Hordeum vulgare]|nr:U-box domain-containing protein 4 [Hordeum vulgare]